MFCKNRIAAATNTVAPLSASSRKSLLCGACAAALALFGGTLAAPPAFAEPSVEEIIAGLGPIAGADNIVTEQEVRDWVAAQPVGDQPSADELNQFIAMLPDVPNIDGNQYTLDAIVAVFQQVQGSNGGDTGGDSGGGEGGSSNPFPFADLQAALIANIGEDGVLTEQELRAAIAALPPEFQPDPSELNDFIAGIGSSNGTYSIDDVMVHVANVVNSDNNGNGDTGGSGDNGGGELTIEAIRHQLSVIAGDDHILTVDEFRAWAATLPHQPTSDQIDQFLATLPGASDGSITVDEAVAHLAATDGGGDGGNQGGGEVVDNGGGTDTGGGADNGGNGGTAEPTRAEIEAMLTTVAGDDGVLTADELRAWAMTFPEDIRPSAADVEMLISRIQGGGGSFTVASVMTAIAAGDGDGNGDGDNGGGDNGGNGGGEVVDNGGGEQQPGWNCTFGANREDCRNSITGQVSVSATGPGAAITATNNTDISTTGDNQPGIVVQLRPLYDPNTGSNTLVYNHPDMTLVNTGAISTSGAGASAISARGGSNTIRIENSGDISATGNNATGIIVQSGGNLGMGNVVPGGDVVVVNSGNITSGFDASGIEVRSGSNVNRISGGDISITNSGNIHTNGGPAIAAMSVGGDVAVFNAGNLSGFNDWAAIGVQSSGTAAAGSVDNSGNMVLNDVGGGGVSVSLIESYWETSSIGQFGEIRNSGNLSLLGEQQNGLEVYVFNGQASVVNSGQITSSQYWATGISADAGTEDSTDSSVSVQHSGIINLTGASSTGIQISTPMGSLDVQSSGDVRATGANSIGIFTVGVFGGTSHIDITGGSVRGGSGSTAFESAGYSEDHGTEFTGSAGILMLGANTNEILNSGTISAVNGQAIATFEGALTVYEWDDEQQERVPFTLDIPVADTTIYNRAAGLIDGNVRLGSGDDRIFNAGRIDGDIDMAGGVNLLENAAGGILTGSSIIVGAGNTLTNSGVMSPGGTGVITETVVVGNFVQTATGSMVIDINEGAGVRNDTINVSGTATLAGTVTPNIIDLDEVVQSEYRVLTSQGLTDNGIIANPAEVQVTDTIGYDFEVEQRDNDLFLLAERQRTASEIAAEAAEASGASGEAQQNYQALGNTLEQLEDSGDDSVNVVLNSVRLQDGPANAAKVMDRLIPQQQGSQAGGASRSGASFGNAMLSCSTRDGEYAYTREGKCYYAKLTVRRLEHDASASGAGVKETGTEAMGGVQFDIGGERRLGLAFGYEDINAKAFSTAQSLGSSEGQRYQGGIVLKDQWGPINAYLNIAGNYTDLDSKRFVNAGGFSNAQAEHEVISGLVKLRLSYLRDMGAFYVKPLVDVGASYIHLGGYTETGAGAFNLAVTSTDKWLFSVMPGLEIGGEMRDGGGTIWRPYIRAGVTVYNDDSLTINARFAEAAANVAGFNVTSGLDTVYADIDAGMHVLTTSGINLRFNYEGRYGESTRQHAGTIKFSLPY